MKKTTETNVNKLNQQVKQLQDEIYYLHMKKDILEEAGEFIKDNLLYQTNTVVYAVKLLIYLGQISIDAAIGEYTHH